MSHIRFDYSKALTFFGEHEITYLKDAVKTAHRTLHDKSGAGNDFLGWIDLPVNYDKEEFNRIQKAAEKIQNDSDVLLVIGIGGSYLGARAAIEMLNHSFYNVLSKEKRKTPQIIFLGNNISSTYMTDVMDLLQDKNFSINVISKSGTTTEPAIAFRIFQRNILNIQMCIHPFEGFLPLSLELRHLYELKECLQMLYYLQSLLFALQDNLVRQDHSVLCQS